MPGNAKPVAPEGASSTVIRDRRAGEFLSQVEGLGDGQEGPVVPSQLSTLAARAARELSVTTQTPVSESSAAWPNALLGNLLRPLNSEYARSCRVGDDPVMGIFIGSGPGLLL